MKYRNESPELLPHFKLENGGNDREIHQMDINRNTSVPSQMNRKSISKNLTKNLLISKERNRARVGSHMHISQFVSFQNKQRSDLKGVSPLKKLDTANLQEFIPINESASSHSNPLKSVIINDPNKITNIFGNLVNQIQKQMNDDNCNINESLTRENAQHIDKVPMFIKSVRKGWADRDPTQRQQQLLSSEQSVSSDSDNAISEMKDTIQDMPLHMSRRIEELKSNDKIQIHRVTHKK